MQADILTSNYASQVDVLMIGDWVEGPYKQPHNNCIVDVVCCSVG